MKKPLIIGIGLFVLFASLDITLTLIGMDGDLQLEGNILMRKVMEMFGPLPGMLIEKGLVLVVALIVAVVAFRGIDQEAEWVYWLALTPMTKRWMRKKKTLLGCFFTTLPCRNLPGSGSLFVGLSDLFIVTNNAHSTVDHLTAPNYASRYYTHTILIFTHHTFF